MRTLFFILILSKSILSFGQDTLKITVDELIRPNEIYGISTPILLRDDIGNYTGIEYTRDSLWTGRIVLNREQYWFDESKLKDSLFEYYLNRIKEFKIDAEKLSDTPLKTYIPILVKIKNGKKIVIVDSNNNYNFSDDDVNIYSFTNDKLFYEDYRNINVSKVRYQKFQNGVPKDYYIDIKVKPYDVAYGYKNKLDSVKAVYFMPVNFYKGKLNVENENLEITINRTTRVGFSGDPTYFQYSITPENQKIRRFDWIDLKQKVKINNRIFEVINFSEEEKVVTIATRPTSSSDFGWNVGDYLPENILNIYFAKSFKKKKYNIIDFWGSWCAPCIQEIPQLADFYNKNLDVINLVSISCEYNEEGISKAKEIVESKKMVWDQKYSFIKDNNALSKLLNVNVYPSIIVIDHNGMIIKREIGSGSIDTIKKSYGLH